MTCNCTSNTLVREFTAIKGATLVIAGNMTAGGIAMNLAGYVFTIEFFSDSSHSTPSLSPMNAVVSGSSYTFTVILPSTK